MDESWSTKITLSNSHVKLAALFKGWLTSSRYKIHFAANFKKIDFLNFLVLLA